MKKGERYSFLYHTKMEEIKYSIIIPVYNTEKYLYKCLNSVLEQKNCEVIVINDGSKDNSLNIIKEYSDKINNLIIIDRENKGVLYTRVEGVKKARGKYILFVDSDDYIPENLLEIYDKVLEEDDYDIIRGNYYADKNGQIDKINNYTKQEIISSNDILDKLYYNILNSNHFNSVWGQAIKKEIINLDEINTSISMGDDIEFNQSCYKNIKKMKIITDYLYYYRRNDSSMTRDITVDRLKRNIYDLNNVYTTIIKNVKNYNNDNLLKNAYCSYLKNINYYFYMFINNSSNKKEFFN